MVEDVESFLQERENVKKLANFLYNNVVVREAVQINKRVDYFRGRKLVSTVLDKSFQKKFKSLGFDAEESALKIGVALLKFGFIHASVVKNKERRELQPIRTEKFTNEGYYTWIYETSSFKRNALLGLIIFGFLTMVMFPIWPTTLKTGSWYVSVTFLIAFFGLAIVRLILFILVWIAGYDFWIFPNLFDDDASVIDSFIPAVSFSKGSSSSEAWMTRGVIFLGLVITGFYLYTQPTELEEILVIQRQFVSDLYEGKLLSNEEEFVEQDYQARGTPDLETLKKELEEDEAEEDIINSLIDKEEL